MLPKMSKNIKCIRFYISYVIIYLNLNLRYRVERDVCTKIYEWTRGLDHSKWVRWLDGLESRDVDFSVLSACQRCWCSSPRSQLPRMVLSSLGPSRGMGILPIYTQWRARGSSLLHGSYHLYIKHVTFRIRQLLLFFPFRWWQRLQPR